MSSCAPRPAAPVPGTARPRPLAVHRLSSPEVSRSFRAAVSRSLEHDPNSGFDGLSAHLRRAGEEVLGFASNGQPSWRDGHDEELRRLSAQRQQAFVAARASPGDAAAAQALREARHANRAAARRMKAQWWSQQSQAMQASAERGDARAFYGDVKRLGRWFSTRGLIRRPLCADRAAACHRFAEHFEHVLNVDRPVVDSTWQGLPVHDCSALVPGLWDPPDIAEVTACLRKLARNKSPDAFGIHAELLHALVADDPAELGPLRHLHCLVCDYWADRPVSHERWLTAILVPIFKGKGDFDDLGNHRGIVLLDVLSKLVSRVLNERLLPVVERVCTETEFGFRRGRGVADAVFTLRRLLEVWGRTRPLAGEPPAEHDCLNLLFVDLSKAFDSVNRQKLWTLLSDKLGVPPHFISMLIRMHERMQAHVLHTGRLGPTVPMRTGVRQGSVEGPTLYLLFYAFVLAEWRRRCRQQHGPSHGVEWVSSRDGTLREPSRTRRAQRDSVRITDLSYADDTLLVDTDWDRFSFPPIHLIRSYVSSV